MTYKKVKGSAVQSQQASQYLQRRYATGADLRLGIEAILADLAWDNERTTATEVALVEVAEHLGLAGQRPEQEFGRGSDVLWALGEQAYAVIEAKSGATGDLIWKKDINQLAGSVNWFTGEYGRESTVTPVMLHPQAMVEKSGTAPHGTRVITPDKLEALKASIRAYATALAVDDAYRDSAKVVEQLERHKLSGGTLIPAYTVSSKQQR